MRIKQYLRRKITCDGWIWLACWKNVELSVWSSVVASDWVQLCWRSDRPSSEMSCVSAGVWGTRDRAGDALQTPLPLGLHTALAGQGKAFILMTSSLSSYSWPQWPHNLILITSSSSRHNLIMTSTLSPLSSWPEQLYPPWSPPWPHHPNDLFVLMTRTTSSWPHRSHDCHNLIMASSPPQTSSRPLLRGDGNFHILSFLFPIPDQLVSAVPPGTTDGQPWVRGVQKGQGGPVLQFTLV